MSNCLAIIGTAGRGDDAKALTVAHWRMMVCIGQTVVTMLECDHLVSGGSAVADHVAVQLFLDGAVKRLTLHLPTSFKHYDNGDAPHFVATDSGARLNQLHAQFSRTANIDSLVQIARAIELGAEVHVNPGGFKARNSDVANAATHLLAMTLAGSCNVAEGGTADTMRKFLARRDAAEAERKRLTEPAGRAGNQPIYWQGQPWPAPLTAFHFDLVERRMHRL